MMVEQLWVWLVHAPRVSERARRLAHAPKGLCVLRRGQGVAAPFARPNLDRGNRRKLAFGLQPSTAVAVAARGVRGPGRCSR